jgi:hypothetical protein
VCGLCAAAIAMSGCESTRQHQNATPGVAGATNSGGDDGTGDRIFVVEGRPFVIPLRPDELPSTSGGRRTLLTKIGEQTVSMRVVRITLTPWQLGAGDVAPDRWLPSMGVWSSADVLSNDQRAASLGSVVAIGIAPTSLAKPADSIDLGSRRVPLQWETFPRPESEPSSTPDKEGAQALDLESSPWASPLNEAARRSLARFESALTNDPLQRWRYRLALGLLDARAEPTFEDPALESIARWNEDRWRVALRNIWTVDRSLAGRLTARLCLMVDTGNDRWWPAWPPTTDLAGSETLLKDLTNPVTTPGRKIELAELWLREQPVCLAWIIDDAAALTPSASSNKPLADVGIANLSDRATLGWTSERDGSRSQDLLPVPATSVISLRTLAPNVTITAPTPTGRPITAHAGSWEHELITASEAIAVNPPGLTIGPFLDDWSLATWTAGSGTTPASDWSTAALLHRPVGIAGESKWQLFVECRSVAGVGKVGSESVQVAFGPSVSPILTYRVGIDGQVTHRRTNAEDQSFTVPVTRGRDRWSFRLDLPANVIERGDVLRIGLCREDALGRRSAWPRAMAPWQNAPARALLDLSAWR